MFMKTRILLASAALLSVTASSFAGSGSPVRSSRFAGDGVIVTPTVQLGDRVANGENSFAIVWQTEDRDGAYSLTWAQGSKWETAKMSYRTIKVTGIEPHRFYTAVIKGYKPGARLEYKLNLGDKNVYSGVTMSPKAENQPYEFAVFGDCGIGTNDEALVSFQTAQRKPDLLLLTGDLVYGSGRISEYRKNFYPYYTAEFPSPKNGSALFANTLTAAAPGNHDILDRGLDKHPDGLAYFYYWAQPLNGPITNIGNVSSPTLSGGKAEQDAFLAGATSNYPRLAMFSFDFGNAHITSLDANRYVDWTDPKLRAWLRDDLAKAAKKTWRFVMFHQPGFHSSATHQDEKQMRQVADLFEEGKVDIVFAGHVHNYQRSFPIQVNDKKGATKAELAKDDWSVDKSFDGEKNTKPNGVVYIVDGAGGAHLYNPELNGKPELWKPFQATYFSEFSLSMVKVAGKTLTLRQLDVSGKELDRMVITK